MGITPHGEILRHYNFFSKTDKAFDWLDRSIAINAGRGSSGFYHILKGWSAPYPETTGYIIQTYLDYYTHFQDLKYFKPASDLGRWLVGLYTTNRFFPGGLGENKRPLVFDSAQILQGLTSLYEITEDPFYRDAVENTTEWLVNVISNREKWINHSITQGYVPAYHSRVVWILLESAEKLNMQTKTHSLHAFIDHLIESASAQGWLENYGPELHHPVSTHFIAYTLQGILECGHLLKNYEYIEWVRKTCDKILGNIKRKKTLPGQYYSLWRPDTRFTCLVGNAQFSLIYSRLYELTGELDYFKAAVKLLKSVVKRQSRIITRGGIPGSHPMWGPYQRFKYPNWAVKFFLDAYLKLFILQNILRDLTDND